MALDTIISTSLKGSTGNTTKVFSNTTLDNGDQQIILAEYLPSGSEVAPTNRATFTVPRGNTIDSGSTIPADSNTDGKDGDLFLDVGDHKIYERGDVTTGVWRETADLTGATGATPNISAVTTTLAPGQDATTSITGTQENPVFNFGQPQGAAGKAKSSPFIVNQPNDYVEVLVGSVGSQVSTEFATVTFSSSKFGSGTGFTVAQGKVLKLASDGSASSATGLADTGDTFETYYIDNTGTAAEAATKLVSEIQVGYPVKGVDGRFTGLTWQFSASLKEGATDVVEFRDNAADLTATLSNFSFSPVWTSTDVAETETSQYTNGGVVYTTGDFAHRVLNSVQTFFICNLGFTTIDTNGTDNFPGVDSDHWNQYSPASTGASAGTLLTTTTTRVPGYVTVTLDDNPNPIPSSFPGFNLELSSDGAAYNKFGSDTPGVAFRNQLLFTTFSGTDVTNSGFQTATGADNNQWVHYRFDNTVDLTATQVATDLASNITSGEDCGVCNDPGLDNGETWNLDGTTDGGVLELRATGGANLSGVFSDIGTGIGWVGANIAEVPAVTSLVTEQSFTAGAIILRSGVAYICILSYNSNDNTALPADNTTNWTALNT